MAQQRYKTQKFITHLQTNSYTFTLNAGAAASQVTVTAQSTLLPNISDQVSIQSPFGIYVGSFRGQNDNGGFAMMVLTNGQGIAVVGLDIMGPNIAPTNVYGIYAANFKVAADGGFTVNNEQGGIAEGFLTPDGSILGNFVTPEGDTGALEGVRKLDTGIQQANAGYYTGTVSGQFSGSAYAIMAADGTIFLFTIVSRR